jgi:hypothetical protein
VWACRLFLMGCRVEDEFVANDCMREHGTCWEVNEFGACYEDGNHIRTFRFLCKSHGCFFREKSPRDEDDAA